MPDTRAEVRLLDGSYSREVRSLLYHAYRHEPTFAYLFESDRPGFDQRVRATIRELVNQHFLEELPSIGLLLEDRLVGVALIVPPQRRLDVTESWFWRMRMLLTTGLGCTRRYLDYHAAVIGCLPPGPYHILPLIGVHPEFQGKHLGEQLLDALHTWCAEDGGSQGWCWIRATHGTWSSIGVMATRNSVKLPWTDPRACPVPPECGARGGKGSCGIGRRSVAQTFPTL